MTSLQPSVPALAVQAGKQVTKPFKRVPHKTLIISAVVIFGLLGGFAGFWYAPNFLPVTLVDFESSNGFALKAPKGYAVDTTLTSSITRLSKRDGGIITSGVIVTKQQLTQAIELIMMNTTDSAKATAQLKDTAGVILTDMLERKYTVKVVSLTQAADKDGNKVYRASAEVGRSGKTGRAEMSLVFTDKQFYAVSVMSNNSSAQLLKKADIILDSFTPAY